MRVGNQRKALEAMELSNREPGIARLTNSSKFDAVGRSLGWEPLDYF
jgi:hypothetical protein